MIMKKILFSILLVLMFVPPFYAQRLNERGQKMVREIEVNRKNGSEYTIVTKYFFFYDNNNRLNGLDIYEGLYDRDKEEYSEPIVLKDSYRYSNYHLTHISNRKVYSKSEWEYEFDENGCLVKEVAIHHGNGDFDNKEETFYTYNFDRNNKTYHLSERIIYFSNRFENSKLFVREKTKALPDIYTYENGYLSWKNIKTEPSNIVNDTNLSFSWILNGYGDLDMTEWLCMRSDYMPQMKQPHFMRFDYSFDDKGNIINIKLRDKDSGFIPTEVSIKYVK